MLNITTTFLYAENKYNIRMVLSQEDKELLIELAKETINSEINNTSIKKELLQQVQKFDIKQGVFVTITKDGELKGCIGHVLAIEPLWQAIIDCARSAAFNDPRFPSLKREEFPFIKIEISVLSPLERLKVEKPEEYLNKIEIGKHGLFIEGKSNSGLLLPQVFPEWNADALKALQMTCKKAGMNVNAWKDLTNRIYVFSAEIFSEK